jgi:orotate phosphoribosyltransferase
LKKAVVHGKEILSSAKEAPNYVDLCFVTLNSTSASLVSEVMLDLTKELDYEAVGEFTPGAGPVATDMMHVAAKKGENRCFSGPHSRKSQLVPARNEWSDLQSNTVLAI